MLLKKKRFTSPLPVHYRCSQSWNIRMLNNLKNLWEQENEMGVNRKAKFGQSHLCPREKSINNNNACHVYSCWRECGLFDDCKQYPL